MLMTFADSEISGKELNDLLATGFFLALAVAVLASIIDSRLKKWYEEGKTYKAWVTFSILIIAAVGSAVAVRVVPGLSIQLVPHIVEVPVPIERGMSGLSPRTIFLAGHYNLTIFLFVSMFLSVGFLIRKLIDGQLYSIDNVTRYLTDSAIMLMVTTMGIIFYRIIAFSSGSILLAGNAYYGFYSFVFLIPLGLLITMLCLQVNQSFAIENAPGRKYRERAFMRIAMMIIALVYSCRAIAELLKY
jgi:hypothetical protein